MELIERVKAANRIRTNDEGITEELCGLIDAAKRDMASNGIIEKPEDGLYCQAIILYTKAHFGYDNPDAERFLKNYEETVKHMACSKDYI